MILDFIIAVFSSAAVVAIVSSFLPRYLERKLKAQWDKELEGLRYEHSKQLAALEAKLKVLTNAANQIASDRYIAFKQITSLAYRAKNLSRAIVFSDEIMASHSVCGEFNELASQLSSSIEEHRLLFDQSMFLNYLHPFKKTVQDFATKLTHRDRCESQGNAELQDTFRIIDKRYPELIEVLQKAVEPQ